MVPHNSYDDHEATAIIEAVQNLETTIRELHEILEIALGDMDALRHKATGFQRSLLQVKKSDNDTDTVIQELGRIMRGFQEQGRLFETVAEPLKLTDPDIAANLQRSVSDLTNIMNPQNKDP